MKITIILPIKKTRDVLFDASEIYLSRIPKLFRPAIVFSPPKGDKNLQSFSVRVKAEGESLLKISTQSFRIALSEEGKKYSSKEFSKYLQSLKQKHSSLSFLIGGPYGLSTCVKENAHALISLSSMTLPHKMALLFLSEQLYRANEIEQSSPYHK